MKKVLFVLVTIIVLVASMVVLTTPAFTQPQKLTGPIRGGVLRVANVIEPPYYDPHRLTGGRLVNHSGAVFSALVRPDPMKEEVSSKTMTPDLAESWDISPDGKTYTFNLRRGVTFHDGRPLTSKDVKYSLDKFRDPKRSALSTGVKPIESVEIVDDYKVRVRLLHPYPELLVYLTSPFAAIEPEHLKDVNPKSTDFLVGTGPFKFKEHIPGKVFIYERNPNYFVPGLPYVDRYEVYILEQAAVTDAFIGGNLDVCGSMRSYLDFGPHILKVQKYAPEAVTALKPFPYTRGIHFSFARKGPWNDLRVRKAMAMVVDYHEVVVPAFGGREVKPVEGAGLLPFYMPGAFNKEEVAKAYGVDKPLEQRIVDAKRLVKEAGYPDGFQVDGITITGGPFWSETMSYLADIWKRHLNINMKVRILESAVFYPLVDKGDFEVLFHGLQTQTDAEAYGFLSSMTSGQIQNYVKWSNKEYDALVGQLMSEGNEAKRLELVRKAQSIFYAEMPYVSFGGVTQGTGWRPDLRMGWPAIEGIVIQPSYTNASIIDRIWFEGTAKRWTKTK